MNKDYAVIGLGRFGGSIVRELRVLEMDVLAVDVDENRVNEFIDIATQAVIGDTTDETVLKDLDTYPDTQRAPPKVNIRPPDKRDLQISKKV